MNLDDAIQNNFSLVSIVFIPLQAKRVREFIEIRDKKISPTRILSTLGVTLSLCGQNFFVKMTPILI